MKFRLLEYRYRRWGSKSRFQPIVRKSLEEWFKTYLSGGPAREKGWKNWDDVLRTGDMTDFASIDQYVDTTPEQREQMKDAVRKLQQKKDEEFMEKLRNSSTESLKHWVWEMEMGDFIPWRTYDKIRAELDRRKKSNDEDNRG